MPPILSVRDLRTYFYTEEGVIHAVDGLSYDLYPSQTLGLVGESGCGKSVHALSILRLVSPPGKIAGGQILYQGKSLLELSQEEIRKVRGDRIAMIFQEPMTSLNPVLTLGDQIAETLVTHRAMTEAQALQKAQEALDHVKIPHPKERLNDYPHQFSGGMRQRVMIAMALVLKPDVLIADEPTTALDVTIQAQILHLMKELQKEMGMAIILITHNLGVVAEIADEVVVMYAGQAVEKGPVKELLGHPKHPYTWGLLNSIPKLHEKKEFLTPIEGQPPHLVNPEPGCRFLSRCAYAMRSCRQDPLFFDVGVNHQALCWLHDPKLPVEDKPVFLTS